MQFMDKVVDGQFVLVVEIIEIDCILLNSLLSMLLNRHIIGIHVATSVIVVKNLVLNFS